MQKTTYIIFISLLLVFACKKQKQYPEDPKKTSQTPHDRLSGNWQLVDYTLNGTSVVDELNLLSKNKFNIKETELGFNKGVYGGMQFTLDGANFRYQPSTQEPTFIDDSFILLKFYSDTLFNNWFITPFKNQKVTSVNWIVTELYRNDLHLVLKTDTGEYKIFWKKK